MGETWLQREVQVSPGRLALFLAETPSAALRFLNSTTRKPRAFGLGLLPPGLHCFTMRILDPGGPPAIIVVEGLFKEMQMVVGVPYLAVGVCVLVAAWLVMNWLI